LLDLLRLGNVRPGVQLLFTSERPIEKGAALVLQFEQALCLQDSPVSQVIEETLRVRTDT
jgi:hypothetical protein